MPKLEITPENFKDYIGRSVEVESLSKIAAFLCPENNILLSYVDNIWYFKSSDIDTDEEMWRYEVTKDWQMSVFLIP